MWGLFFIAAAIVALSLFLPSYLVLRGFRIDGIVAVSSAPLISVAVYVLLGLLYAQFGISSSWVSLFLPYLVVSVILFACGARKSAQSKSLRLGLGIDGWLSIHHFRRRISHPSIPTHPSNLFDWVFQNGAVRLVFPG